jgi:hypothetical protein
MNRRTMLSRTLAAGAAAVAGPVLWSGAADASAGPPAGTASTGGSGTGAAQVPLFNWTRSLPIDSMSPGIGTFGGTELRGLATMDGYLYAGYDPGQPGGIDWGSHPEAGISPTEASERVMSFAQCNGKLYATVGWQIYERQDGKTPSWTHVFTWGHDRPLNGNGGLRGLTSIANPAGAGEVLLVAAEGAQGLVLRIAPPDWPNPATDLHVLSFATKELDTTVEAVIVAYNNMTRYISPSDDAGAPGLLIGGYDAKITSGGLGSQHKAPGAYVLLRQPGGGYRCQQVLDPAITPTPDLVATRTIIGSPFAADPPGTVYAGGFDAGNLTPHNSAWLYRGAPHTA